MNTRTHRISSKSDGLCCYTERNSPSGVPATSERTSPPLPRQRHARRPVNDPQYAAGLPINGTFTRTQPIHVIKAHSATRIKTVIRNTRLPCLAALRSESACTMPKPITSLHGPALLQPAYSLDQTNDDDVADCRPSHDVQVHDLILLSLAEVPEHRHDSAEHDGADGNPHHPRSRS